MFFPHGLAGAVDFPGVAMIGSPKPLYIQFCGKDQLFTSQGMKDADASLRTAHSNYHSSIYPVKHSFTKEMQGDAFNWINAHK